MPTLALVRGGELIASYPLDKPVVVVGRDEVCDIKLTGALVSREHCRFVASGGTYVVEDLGSRNGTHLNGAPVDRQELVEGDKIVVVPHILVYHAEERAPLAAPVPAGDEGPVRGMATAGVDAAEVRRQLAKLHAEAESYGFGVSYEALGEVDVVKVSGPIDGRTSGRLANAVEALLAEGRCRIAVDMAEATYLASEGVATLLSAAERAQAGGGRLVLVSPARQVRAILDLGFARAFKIAADRWEALSLF